MLKQAENTRDFFFIHFDSTSLFSHHMHVSACFVFVNLYGSHQLHHTAMLILLLPFFVHIQMGKIMGPCIMCTTIESFNIHIYIYKEHKEWYFKRMPEWEFLPYIILFVMRTEMARTEKNIQVFLGLVVVYGVEVKKMVEWVKKLKKHHTHKNCRPVTRGDVNARYWISFQFPINPLQFRTSLLRLSTVRKVVCLVFEIWFRGKVY